MNLPGYVPFTERLGEPTTDGTYPVIQVEVPQNRDDAFEVVAMLDRLFLEGRLEEWKAVYRQYTATSWYVTGLLLSGGRRLDPYTGRAELDCDFQFNFAAEMQFDGDGVLDKSARGHFKSFWRNYAGLTVEVNRDPDLVVIIVAHDKGAAAKNGIRTMQEWEINDALKLAWPEVYYQDPKREAPVWSKEAGCTVRRNAPAVLPTLSWWPIDAPPTGGRVGLFVFDDVENEQTVESDEMREKTTDRFTSFLELGGRQPRIWINGTHHHPQGLVKLLGDSGAWRVRCHAAEDLSKPPPDIAKLYDECGGRRPDGQLIPPKVRDVRLDGEPVFLHPLELAQKRLQAETSPRGLAAYFRQNMGDAFAGQERQLDSRLLRYYTETPEERAEDAVLVMTVDGSKGIRDPTFAMVWALHPDETISLVGALRRLLKPSQFGPEIFNFHALWENVGGSRATFDHIRVEIFAQAVYDWMISSYFEDRGKWVQVVPIGRSHVTNRRREYDAIEPFLRRRRLFFPKNGIIIEGDNGESYDVVEYLVQHELGEFPMLTRDDGVASMALLGEPVNEKKGIHELPFPDDEEAMRRRAQHADREERYLRGPGNQSALDATAWWEH